MEVYVFGNMLVEQLSKDVRAMGERAKEFREKGDEKLATEITLVGAAMMNIASAVVQVMTNLEAELKRLTDMKIVSKEETADAES